jgi:hypothetical protein
VVVVLPASICAAMPILRVCSKGNLRFDEFTLADIVADIERKNGKEQGGEAGVETTSAGEQTRGLLEPCGVFLPSS